MPGAPRARRILLSHTDGAPPRVVQTQHLRIEPVVARLNAPMAERSPDGALVSHVPSWRALEARRQHARRNWRRLPVVAITHR